MKLWVEIKDFVRAVSQRIQCSQEDETLVEVCGPLITSRKTVLTCYTGKRVSKGARIERMMKLGVC